MEELRKLKQSVAMANAKISYLSEGFKELKDQFETVGHDLDVFEMTQEKVESGLKRIEKHVELD